MSYNIPAKWSSVTLGELTKNTRPICYGVLKPGDYVENGIPLVRITDISANFFDDSNLHLISDELDQEFSRSKLEGGEILISIQGTIGRVAICPEKYAGANISRTIAVIEPDDRVCKPFLYWFLRYYGQQELFDAFGATRASLNISTLRDLNIPLPPLEEQKRIAAILDKADSVRRKRQQAIELADDFLRSVFLDMFGDPVTNPKGWDVKKFGTVIDVLTDYHANGSYKTLNENVTLLDEPNYAYMVRTTDLEKKNYTDNVKYIDQHAYEHLSKTKVYGGELVINKIGSAGAVYLMPYLNRPVSLAMNQFMIRCNEHCLNEFVYYQLKTNAGARELEKRVQGAVTKTITKDAVRDIPIILPPIKLQRQFIDVVEKINKLKTNTDNSSGLIVAKFNSISQKAFAGEL